MHFTKLVSAHAVLLILGMVLHDPVGSKTAEKNDNTCLYRSGVQGEKFCGGVKFFQICFQRF